MFFMHASLHGPFLESTQFLYYSLGTLHSNSSKITLCIHELQTFKVRLIFFVIFSPFFSAWGPNFSGANLISIYAVMDDYLYSKDLFCHTCRVNHQRKFVYV